MENIDKYVNILYNTKHSISMYIMFINLPLLIKWQI